MNLFKILVSLLLIISFCFSTELVQKDLNENNFSIKKGSFKVTEFDKMIKNIKDSKCCYINWCSQLLRKIF